jgi:CheY-like chemotaxis protein
VEGTAERRAPQPASQEIACGTETLLVVEDEDSVRRMIGDVLRGCGYTVLEATDGAEALAVSAGHPGPLHLLLTDVVMPQLSGSELAARLGQQRPGARVLFMSGYTNDAVFRHGVLPTGAPFLAKPFTPLELAAKVRELLDRAS